MGFHGGDDVGARASEAVCDVCDGKVCVEEVLQGVPVEEFRYLVPVGFVVSFFFVDDCLDSCLSHDVGFLYALSHAFSSCSCLALPAAPRGFSIVFLQQQANVSCLFMKSRVQRLILDRHFFLRAEARSFACFCLYILL